MIISQKNAQGFSLLELAIVLVIVGLIVGQFSGLYDLLLSTDREKKERVSIQKIGSSLNTFLASNMFLPCPDTDNDGHEDRDADSSCVSREGYLPYKDIGVNGTDAWGNYYYYRVNQQAENIADITDVCSSASVMGNGGVKSGVAVGGLELCADSNIYYCSGGCSASSVGCSSCDLIDPRENDTKPPYFHLATPPFGTLSGYYNLQIYNEDYAPYDGSNGEANGGAGGNGTVALVISWGANGGSVNRYVESDPDCVGGTQAELENCDQSTDRVFVDTKTGENRDFLTWITVNQAKMALIYNGEFR